MDPAIEALARARHADLQRELAEASEGDLVEEAPRTTMSHLRAWGRRLLQP